MKREANKDFMMDSRLSDGLYPYKEGLIGHAMAFFQKGMDIKSLSDYASAVINPSCKQFENYSVRVVTSYQYYGEPVPNNVSISVYVRGKRVASVQMTKNANQRPTLDQTFMMLALLSMLR